MKYPRKLKKLLFGARPSHAKLRRMVKETVFGPPIVTMWERRQCYPHGQFCPKCGCKGYHGHGNMAEYPEHWEYFYCNRCSHKVGGIDNSAFIHVLECAHWGYELPL